MDTAAQKKGNWFSNLNNNYSSWAGGESFLGGGITNGSLVNAGMGALNMGVNMLAGQNQTGVGNALQTIGGLASNIPGVGGLIGAGVGVVGGLVNAAFGSHINDEFVQQTQLGANQIGSQIFNANTNADLLNDWQNTTQMSNVSKSEVGYDGWFSNKASRKTRELNEKINAANQRQLANFGIAAENVDTQNDLRILQNMAAYGGPINSFRKYYSKGGYLSQAKALIRQNEGWRDKPYADAPRGKQWRSVGYGFNDSGFRDKYPEGISKHYEHGITKKQAEEELDYFLNKADKQLKSIYGKQWNDFTDSQKAAILDTYYQRPASVGKSSRFYKAVTAGEDAGRYLGVAGYDRRNKIRQDIFGGGYSGYGNWSNAESNPNPSALQEVTPFTPVVHDLDLSGITPTEAKALELNLTSPTFDLSIFGKPMTAPTQQAVPTVGTVEDFLASYGDFEDNLFREGGNLYGGGNTGDWMGVAGTTINTLANWGKEDPSLGRGGGYGQFIMAAYDTMKAIRDATKSKRESIEQKLAIPIYAHGGHLFDGGGSMGAIGYAQMGNSVLKLISNVKAQASLDPDIDEGKIHRSINRYGQELDEAIGKVDTNGDLLDLWANNSTIDATLSARDFRDKSYFDDFLNSYAAASEGFSAGAQTGNPYVAAGGAIVGGLSSILGAIRGRNKAGHAAEEANEKIERANDRRLQNLVAAAERVDEENDLRILQNMGANGGKLSMGFGLKDPFIMPDGTANPLYRAFGGGLTHGVGDTVDISPEEARYLKSLGYEFKVIG